MGFIPPLTQNRTLAKVIQNLFNQIPRCSIVPMLTVDDVVAFTWVAKPSVGSNSSSQSKSDQSDQYFQLK
ncbi:hypothetical protein BLOT_010236 [Blomia tropicalis]|nr:hypothetical protein BLOT_010236 [Blomia tropicalis]